MIDDDVLNLERLVEAYDNDIAAIADLLGLARDTERRYLRNLRSAIEDADLRAVASAAHSMKGSASNIGAVRVSGIAARIEDQARRSVWGAIRADAAELDAAYDELCERIALYAANIR